MSVTSVRPDRPVRQVPPDGGQARQAAPAFAYFLP